MFLIHVVARPDSFVPVLQLFYLFRLAFYIAKIERVDVHETEPLAENIKDKQVPVILGSGFSERHLVVYSLE